MPDYELKVESDPGRALDTARTFRPDLFLLDLVMPQMSGTELAERIQHDDDLGHTPIIFLSALILTGEESGPPVLLHNRPAFGKPFSLDELKRCIDQQLAIEVPSQSCPSSAEQE